MVLITEPAFEPVGIEEVKAALRIDDARFDDQLPDWLAGARQQAEQSTGRRYALQTWRTELADWPAAADVLHVHRPSACAVSYWTGSAWESLAAGAYVYAAQGDGTVLAPALGTSWPTLGAVAVGPRVRIDLTSGPASAASVPSCVKTYITAVVGQLVQAPDLTVASVMQTSPLLERLLDSERTYG